MPAEGRICAVSMLPFLGRSVLCCLKYILVRGLHTVMDVVELTFVRGRDACPIFTDVIAAALKNKGTLRTLEMFY